MICVITLSVVLGSVYFQMDHRGLSDEGGGGRTLVGQFEQRLGVLLIMCAFLAFGSLSSLEVITIEDIPYV